MLFPHPSALCAPAWCVHLSARPLVGSARQGSAGTLSFLINMASRKRPALLMRTLQPPISLLAWVLEMADQTSPFATQTNSPFNKCRFCCSSPLQRARRRRLRSSRRQHVEAAFPEQTPSELPPLSTPEGRRALVRRKRGRRKQEDLVKKSEDFRCDGGTIPCREPSDLCP